MVWSVRIVAGAGLLFAALSYGSAAQSVDAKQATELLDSALQALWSFDVQLDVTRTFFLKNHYSEKGRQATVSKRTRRPTPFIDHRYYRQVFQGGKGRIEFLDGLGAKPTQYVVYDSEVEKTFNHRQAFSSVRKPVGNIVGEGEDYFEAFRSVWGRVPLLKCLRERGNVVVKAGGAGKTILETSPLPPGGNIDLPSCGFRVTVATGRGFMPVVLERLEDVQGQLFVVRRTTVTEAKNIGSGVWVPVRVTTQTFDQSLDLGTFGEVYHQVVLGVDLARSSWNRELPEETFELPTPAGTRVTDSFRQVQYVTGNPDPGKNLKDLAADAKDVVPVIVMPPASTTDSPWPIWLILLVLGLILAPISVFYIRRRKQRGHPA